MRGQLGGWVLQDMFDRDGVYLENHDWSFCTVTGVEGEFEFGSVTLIPLKSSLDAN